MARNSAKGAEIFWPKSFRVFRGLSCCSCSKRYTIWKQL